MANKNNFDINILVEISYQSQYLRNHLDDIRKNESHRKEKTTRSVYTKNKVLNKLTFTFLSRAKVTNHSLIMET